MRTRARSLTGLALAAALSGCGGGGEPAPVGPAKRVILISCDTLRADRLGIYGYDRPVSPNLDALARESVVFDEAYASAAHTVPALSSLFTSRLPDEIGATGNRKFIPAELMTLPELLAEFGIPSAAVVSNWALKRDHSGRDDVGIQQGFAHYDDRMTSKELNRDSFERWAPETTAAAVEWLEQRPDGPFFLWVHYQDPHGPYTPPAELAAQFDRPAGDEPPLPVGQNIKGFGQLPSYQVLGDERRPDFYRNRYDAEIRFFDQALGELLDYLKREGLYEDSLIVFTADHGESLGEHDYWFCHGENLHREVVRVPLIVRYPGGSPMPPAEPVDGVRRTSRLAGHVDVMPTVAHALGVPWPKVRGISLLTDDIATERVLAHSMGHLDSPKYWYGLSDGRHRLMIESGRARLYDVLEDPLEQHDLAAEKQGLVSKLEKRYREYVESFGEPAVEGEDMQMDPATLKAMKALGYVDPGAAEHDD